MKRKLLSNDTHTYTHIEYLNLRFVTHTLSSPTPVTINMDFYSSGEDNPTITHLPLDLKIKKEWDR